MDIVTIDKKNTSIKNLKYGRQIVLAVFFFFYNYTYAMISSAFSSLSGKFLDENQSLLHTRLILISFAMALIIFSIILSTVEIKQSILSRIAGIVTLLTPILILIFFKSSNKLLFLISIYALMFIIGIECVYYYRLMYRAFTYIPHTGIVFIISMSCSIFLQFFLQTLINNENFIIYSLLLVTFIVAFMNLSGFAEYLSNTEQEELISSKIPDKRSFITIYMSTVIVIILCEIIGNFLSYPLLSLMFNGESFVYDTPRLFIVLSYIIMGIIADIDDMRFLSVVTLTGVIIGILNPVLIHENSSMYVNTCIYYIVAGIINCYFTLTMFKLARSKRFAPLISVSGRIIDSIFSCLLITPFWLNFPLFYIIGIELAAIIIIMLLFTFSGQLYFSSEKTNSMHHIAPHDFAKQFEFSNKETEVFLAALSFDGTMSELAKSLFISRSVLYRSLSNICDKTGCGSFQAVKVLYYNFPTDTPASTDEDYKNNEYTDINHSLILQSENVPSNIPSLSDEVANLNQLNASNDTFNKIDIHTELSDKIKAFAKEYSLSEKEIQTFTAFLENPAKTQKELADMQGITLRTIQRHLANIKTKTSTKTLADLSKLFYSA
ncbi:MAG: hypothetical protein IJ224_07895 [Lachnospiraceae bacterium]|nr:hypothetical protein [Lachnospiraceae bacterium]